MDNQQGGGGRRAGKLAISARVRSIREETCGDEGVPEVARRLGLPSRTWLNYEAGVTIPGEVMLGFLVLTGAEPLWLLEGRGARYRATAPQPREATPYRGDIG